MKTYKILSIAFIVICVALLIGVLAIHAEPGRKVVLVACLGAVILAMLYNLHLIRKKQKQQE